MCYGSCQFDQSEASPGDPQHQLDGALVAFSKLLEDIKQRYLVALETVTREPSKPIPSWTKPTPAYLRNVFTAYYEISSMPKQTEKISHNYVITLALYTRTSRIRRLLAVLNEIMNIQRTLSIWWRTSPGSLTHDVTQHLHSITTNTNQMYKRVYDTFTTTEETSISETEGLQASVEVMEVSADDTMWSRANEEGLEGKIAVLHQVTEQLLSGLVAQFVSIQHAHLVCTVGSTVGDDVTSYDKQDILKLRSTMPEKYILETASVGAW